MKLVSYMAPGFPHSLFERIGSIIGAEVEFVETSSGPLPGKDPFASGEADLGWICSTSYMQLALSATEPSVKLAGVAWLPNDPDSAGSPVFALDGLGEDPDEFADLVFTGGHRRSLDAVLAGELDAAIVDSVVRINASESDAAVGGLQVIDRLGPWPVQPLVARAVTTTPRLVRR